MAEASTNPEDYNNILRLCWMIYFHFWWGIGTAIFGAFIIFTRLPINWVERVLKPWHAALGQAWIYAVIVLMSTSLYCRADGFRAFIFGFLVILVVNLIIGHIAIRSFQRRTSRLKIEKLTKASNELELVGSDRATIANEPVQDSRLSLYKNIHAVTMILAYLMVFGAGSAFSIRFASTGGCKNLYAQPKVEAIKNGSTIFEFNGELFMGGNNFIPPILEQLDTDL